MKGLLFLIAVLFTAPCYAQDIYDYNHRGGYERFSSRYEVNPPKLYSSGKYLGELSSNRYAPDSISNPYSKYGSRYSPDSVNNKYGSWGRYRTQPIYVYPSRW